MLGKARGGKRANAGRKLGAVSRVSREIAERIVVDGEKQPLEVVIEAMRVHYKAAKVMKEDGTFDWDMERLKEAAVLADRALPYCHARIAQIELPKPTPEVEAAQQTQLEDARRVAFALAIGQHLQKGLPKPK